MGLKEIKKKSSPVAALTSLPTRCHRPSTPPATSADPGSGRPGPPASAPRAAATPSSFLPLPPSLHGWSSFDSMFSKKHVLCLQIQTRFQKVRGLSLFINKMFTACLLGATLRSRHWV